MWLRDIEGDLINLAFVRRLVLQPLADGYEVEAEIDGDLKFTVFSSNNSDACVEFLDDIEGVLNGTDRQTAGRDTPQE